MPYDEFIKWQIFFDIKPPGIEEDSRCLKLLQVQGFKGEPESIFNSFARLKASKDISSLKNSMMYKMMQNSTGGLPLSEILRSAA